LIVSRGNRYRSKSIVLKIASGGIRTNCRVSVKSLGLAIELKLKLNGVGIPGADHDCTGE